MDPYIIEETPAESKRPYYIIAACLGVLLVIAAIAAAKILTANSFGSTAMQLGGREEFSGTTAYGEKISTTDYAGKVIVVDFWATWCPPCVAAVPEMNRLQDSYKDRVQFIGVSLDRSINDLRRFQDKNGAGYPSIFDGGQKLAQLYAIRSIPTVAIIDTKGSVRFVGYPTQLEKNLKQVLNDS
ncbi:MAG: TlpA disulfide reductase family protein [Candidatus Sumerlaeota bacterium]